MQTLEALTRDARALRLVNAVFRDCVASYAWLDLATVVHRLAPWTASFPHARRDPAFDALAVKAGCKPKRTRENDE